MLIDTPFCAICMHAGNRTVKIPEQLEKTKAFKCIHIHYDTYTLKLYVYSIVLLVNLDT